MATNIVCRGNGTIYCAPSEGVGISVSPNGTSIIRSSIIVGNWGYEQFGIGDPDPPRSTIFGKITSISNLFYGNGGDSLFAGGTVDSSDHVHASPLLGADSHLLLHSPAIDHGDAADSDPDGSRADMGAFGGPGAIMSQPARVEGAQGTSRYGITLKWNAVSAPDLMGYAIYRAETSGIHPGLETLLALSQGVETSFVDRFATPNTTYFYRVSAYDASGYGGGYSDEMELTAVSWFGEGVGEGGGGDATQIADQLRPKVERFSLEMRGANPCRGQAEFELALPHEGQVELSIYDISGRRVWNEVRVLEAGYHEVQWKGTWQDGSRVAAGIYFMRAQTAVDASIQRVVLLR